MRDPRRYSDSQFLLKLYSVGACEQNFLRDDIIGETDFHGAVYYGELEAQDLSYAFISEIQSRFQKEYSQKDTGDSGQGLMKSYGLVESLK